MFRVIRALIAVSVTVLGLCGIAACAQKADEPGDVAVRFVTAFCRGDGETALKLLYVPEGKQLTENDRGKLTMLVMDAKEKVEEQGGLKQVSVREAGAIEHDKDGNDCVEVRLEVETGDGDKKLPARVTLVKVKDAWLVKDFN